MSPWLKSTMSLTPSPAALRTSLSREVVGEAVAAEGAKFQSLEAALRHKLARFLANASTGLSQRPLLL